MSKYIVALAIVVVLVCPITTHAGDVDEHVGYVVRVGHLDHILKGAGYVNITVPTTINPDGEHQERFKAEDTWQQGYVAGDEVHYLVYKNRVIRVLPKSK